MKVQTHQRKKNAVFFGKYICDDINAFIHSSKFHNELHADIVIVQKKKKFSEENYRPISILPNISKVYGRSLYDQMSNYFGVALLKYQCAFRKGGSAQHFMLVIKEWKKQWTMEVLLLTDLYKALIASRMTFSFQNRRHLVFKQMHEILFLTICLIVRKQLK